MPKATIPTNTVSRFSACFSFNMKQCNQRIKGKTKQMKKMQVLLRHDVCLMLKSQVI